jgi:ArsR family transcriptional regulator, lead/cadmium/zinc/bismuth-responsive transcriptional repressor
MYERMSNRSHETHPGRGECETFAVDAAAVERVLAAVPDEAATRDVAAIFDALSDPTRLRILQALLVAGELCVCDLAMVTGVTSSAVSHQLRLLRDRDLVAFSREGKRAVYRLADAHVSALLAQGLDHAAERRGAGQGMNQA